MLQKEPAAGDVVAGLVPQWRHAADIDRLLVHAPRPERQPAEAAFEDGQTQARITVEDPANPAGNDLSALLSGVWPELRATAQSVLDAVQRSGWEAVFGSVDHVSKSERIARATVLASAVERPTTPWRA